MENKKSIQLSDEEYKTLLRMSFFGEWVLNSHLIKPSFKKEQALMQKICSYAKTFNASEMINKFGTNEPDYEIKEEFILSFIEDLTAYNEASTWQVLSTMLAARDTFESSGKDMDEISVEQLEQIETLEDAYTDEFEKNGVMNLRIVHDTFPNSSLN